VRRIEHDESALLADIYPYGHQQLNVIGADLSITERRADEATRDVVNWLKCEYLLDRVGEEYTGVVSAVTGFGLFVMLDDLYVEGLIHVTGLPKDYYYHEAAQQRMIGERTGRVFRLGQRLRVIVARVNLDERKIDFKLLSSDAFGDDKKKPSHSRAKGTANNDRQKPSKSRRKSSQKRATSATQKPSSRRSKKG
jgi:ribonuclease R